MIRGVVYNVALGAVCMLVVKDVRDRRRARRLITFGCRCHADIPLAWAAVKWGLQEGVLSLFRGEARCGTCGRLLGGSRVGALLSNRFKGCPADA